LFDAEIKTLKEQYRGLIDELGKRYIDFERIGDSKFYPKNVLLGTGDPPEMFKNPGRSLMFLFSDKPTAIGFVKLASLQIRCNMSPTSANIEVWDVDESGVYFFAFRSSDSASDDGSFKIVNTTEGLKESIVNLDAILQKRLKTIRISYSSIDQYNEDMVKLGSVTENYYTVFVFSPESVIRDEAFKRLLVSGPSVGIYVHIFVEREKLTEQYVDVLERVNACIIASNGRFALNAVEAIISKIREQKKR
jgi:hypothetical protein